MVGLDPLLFLRERWSRRGARRRQNARNGLSPRFLRRAPSRGMGARDPRPRRAVRFLPDPIPRDTAHAPGVLIVRGQQCPQHGQQRPRPCGAFTGRPIARSIHGTRTAFLGARPFSGQAQGTVAPLAIECAPEISFPSAALADGGLEEFHSSDRPTKTQKISRPFARLQKNHSQPSFCLPRSFVYLPSAAFRNPTYLPSRRPDSRTWVFFGNFSSVASSFSRF